MGQTVRLEFIYNDRVPAKEDAVELFVNNMQIDQVKFNATVPHAFTAEEKLDTGEDTGTPAVPYKKAFAFDGHIDTVCFDLKWANETNDDALRSRRFYEQHKFPNCSD